MPVETVIDLVDALRRFRLLEADQLTEVESTLAPRFPDPKALAKELIQRGWITAFQVNKLFVGKGQELVLSGYVLLDRLGEGGMGQVFRARQVSMGRVVALKVIRKDRLRSDQAAKRFQREILAAARLEHPNVARAFDADLSGDILFFAMEYVDGIDLGKWVKQRGPLGFSEACDFMRQAALGLQHAFENGLVHRDIKPANLLVSKNREVKILDMGLVRESHPEGDESNSTLTQENAVMGTPDYLAPEQARDAHRADIRADLYSLGCTLYFLIGGRVPFPGGQLGEKLLKHQLEEPMPLRQLRADLPADVEAVVKRLMSKNPDHRYQTPGQLAEDLGCLLSGERRLIPAAILVGPSAPVVQPVDNPFVDLGGGETIPSGDATPTRKLSDTAMPSMPGTIWTGIKKTGSLLVTGFRGTSSALQPLADKAGIPRQVTSLLLLLFMGLFLIGFVGCLMSGGRPSADVAPEKPANPSGDKKTTAISGPSPLDLLEAKLIPDVERPKWLPREVVAVIGEQEGRQGGPLSKMALCPSGKIFATVSTGPTIYLWDADTLQIQATLKGHTGTVNALVFSTDGKLLCSGGSDKTIRLWHLDGFTATEGAILKEHEGSVVGLALSTDGKRLASGSMDKSVVLWALDGKEAKKERRIADFEEEVRAVAFSQDSKLLAAGDAGAVRWWDIAGDEPAEKKRCKVSTLKLFSLRFAPNDRMLVAGGAGWVHVLKVDGKVEGELEQEVKQSVGGNVYAVAINADDPKLIAVAGNEVEVLRLVTDANPKIMRANAPFHAVFVEWLPGHKTFLSGTSWGLVRRFEIKGSKIEPSRPLIGHPGEVTALAISPDGKSLATGGGSIHQKMFVWSLEGPKPRQIAEVAPGFPVHALAFSPDRKFLAAAGQSKPYFVVWDLTTKNQDFNDPKGLTGINVAGHTRGIASLAFSPDSKTLISGGIPEMCTWDFRSGYPKDPASVQDKQGGTITSLAFRADGKWLASGSTEGKIALWEMSKNVPVFKHLIVKAPNSTRVAFDPDDKTLFSGGFDGGVRCWDLSDQAELTHRYPGHKGTISAVTFSPNGRKLATADRNGTLILWDMTSSNSQTFKLEVPITQAAFAPDSRHLAVATAASTVLIFRLAEAQN